MEGFEVLDKSNADKDVIPVSVSSSVTALIPKCGVKSDCAPNVKRMLVIAPAYVDWMLVITRWMW